MDDDIAIKVDDVTKTFKLPHDKNTSIKSAVLNFYKTKKSFERQIALSNISFDIKKGEFFGIVGKNGSGKSTLLKILAGIYAPNEGSVHINGKLTPFIELGVGFSPELTGRENVFLNGALLGFSRDEMEAMYDSIVDFAEIRRFMDQKLKNYSSGMQVRLAFAIAIRAESEILLIDEVLAVGDAAFQKKCYDYFYKIKKEHRTVIFVTHDMSAVQTYCDRALMIQNSKVVAIGTPRDIALQYEVANIAKVETKEDSEIELRPKNPSIKIDNISVFSDTEEKNNFRLKEDINIKVDFTVHKTEDVQFNLFFISSDGDYMAGINTTRDLKVFNPQPGKHSIKCKIEGWQLSKGEYSLGVGVYTYEEPATLIDVLDPGHSKQTIKIDIIEKSPLQDGKFYIKGKWSK